MIFWFFLTFWIFFLYFYFFYRTCAERAQEHTRTHTALTAGVEGEEPSGSCAIYTDGRVITADQSPFRIVGKSQQRGVAHRDDEIALKAVVNGANVLIALKLLFSEAVWGWLQFPEVVSIRKNPVGAVYNQSRHHKC